MNKTTYILLSALALGLSACDKAKDEEAKAKAKEAAEKTGEALKSAGEAVKAAAINAKEKLPAAVEKAAEDAKAAIHKATESNTQNKQPVAVPLVIPDPKDAPPPPSGPAAVPATPPK